MFSIFTHWKSCVLWIDMKNKLNQRWFFKSLWNEVLAALNITTNSVKIIKHENAESLDFPKSGLWPEIIDPVFVKTSPKRSFSVTEYERFGLVFTNTRVYKFGHPGFLGKRNVAITRKSPGFRNKMIDTVISLSKGFRAKGGKSIQMF